MSTSLRALAGALKTAIDAAARALSSANVADASAKAASKAAQDAATQKDATVAAASTGTGAATVATTQAGIATSKATEATTQAGIATTQAGIATSKAAEATTAKVAAEAARDGLNSTGKVFTAAEGTAAGIAATTNGQQFAVLSSDATTYGIWRNNAGVAQSLSSLFTAAFLDFIMRTSVTGYAFTFQDSLRNVCGGVTDDGTLRWANALFDRLTIAALSLDANSVIGNKLPAGWNFGITDSRGQITGGHRDDGVWQFAQVLVNALTVSGTLSAPTLSLDANSIVGTKLPAGWNWGILDSRGSLDGGHRDDGVWQFAQAEIRSLNGRLVTDVFSQIDANLGTFPAPNFDAEYVLVPTYGQSLSRGYSTSTITLTQPGTALRFTSTAHTALGPLTEPCPDGEGETPSAGTAAAIQDLIALENRIAPTAHAMQLVACNPGQNGMAIAGLAKGQPAYTTFLNSVTAAKNLAAAAGKTFVVPAFVWMQGEGDYSVGTATATYKAALIQLRSDLDADIRAITGQTQTVKCICYQVASHLHYGRTYPNIALVHYDLANTDPNFTLSTPMYVMDYNASDNVHLLSASSKLTGAYNGKGWKRLVVDRAAGTSGWLRPLTFTVQGSIIVIEFSVPRAPLVLDTATVTAHTNYGFNLVDAGGADLGALTVSVIEPTKLKIVCPVNVVAGMKLQAGFYASPGGVTGRTNGPRTNLRDSFGDVYVFDPTSINRPLHNFCPMFEKVF